MFKSSRSFSTVNAERLEKNELYQYEHVIRSSMTKTNHDNSNIKYVYSHKKNRNCIWFSCE